MDSIEHRKVPKSKLDLTQYSELLKEKMDSFSKLHPDTKPLKFRTQNPRHKIDLTWTIHNFSKSADNFRSDPFKLPKCDPEYECALISSVSKKKTQDLDLELRRIDNGYRGVSIRGEFTATNGDDKVIAKSDESSGFLSTFTDCKIVLSFRDPVKSQTKKHRVPLPGDVLILRGLIDVRCCCISTDEDGIGSSDAVAVAPTDKAYKFTLRSSADGEGMVNQS